MRKVYMTIAIIIGLLCGLLCLEVLELFPSLFEELDLLSLVMDSAELFVPLFLISRSAYLVINKQHPVLNSMSILFGVTCVLLIFAGYYDIFDPGDFLTFINNVCNYLLALNFIYEVKAIDLFHKKFQLAMAIGATVLVGLSVISDFSPEFAIRFLDSYATVQLINIILYFEIAGFLINPMIGAIVNELIENPYSVSRKRRDVEVEFNTTPVPTQPVNNAPTFIPANQQSASASATPQPIQGAVQNSNFQQVQSVAPTPVPVNNQDSATINSAIPTPGAPIIPNKIDNNQDSQPEIPTIIQ